MIADHYASHAPTTRRLDASADEAANAHPIITRPPRWVSVEGIMGLPMAFGERISDVV